MLNQHASYRTFNGQWPEQGPRASRYVLDFSAATLLLVERHPFEAQGELEFVQSVYVDNSANGSAVTLTSELTNQSITIPPASQGYFPFLVPNGIDIWAATAGGVEITIHLLNIPVPASCWGIASPGGGAGGGTAGIFVDRGTTITLGGTAQTLMASNTARRRLIIENPTNAPAGESIFINFGAVAAADETSIEITPAGWYDSGSGPVSNQSVSVIAATTGHEIVAKEM